MDISLSHLIDTPPNSQPDSQLYSQSNEALLQPIDSSSPAGDYLRYDPLYDRIAQARHAEDASLPQGVWQRPTQQADWPLVVELCTEALTYRSKDLQIAVWITEAWLHLEGLAGYAKGCNLILNLHQHFAATMHPAPEFPVGIMPDMLTLPLSSADPSVEHRANLIQWLNEKLSLQVKLLPLTLPSAASGVAPFSLADLEAALYQDQLQRRQNSSPMAVTGVNAFERSLALTPLESLVGRWTEVRHAIEATDALDQMFDVCYGKANGGLLKLKDILRRMELAIAPALPDIQESEMDQEDETDPEMQNHRSNSSLSTMTYVPTSPSHMTSRCSDSISVSEYGTTIQSREDAYTRLAEISEFLSQLEPHSPVPYLLQRAIAWGGMSLSELLPELLQDQVALKEVGILLRLDGSNQILSNK
ncbi:MAG: type VI secretion system ImpA family N-terminal domain-containing protein [Edaphobacter sp.]